MNKNKLLLLIPLSLLIPTIAYADCTKEEIQEFKEVEEDYKITYEFDKDTKLYSLTFYAPKSDVYNYIGVNNNVLSNCKTIDVTTVECSNINSGTYNFNIVGVTQRCNNTLKKIELTLPKYNSYSESQLCEGIEEFVLCQPTYDKEIDYDTFVSRINSYKKSKREQENKNKETTEKEQSKLLQYINDNLFQIIIVAIFIIMVIITIILSAKSIKKSRRLE